MIIFKKYRRKGLSEMVQFKEFVGEDMSLVSVSDADKKLSNEEFEQGYIARNPKNHQDLWYVAKKYFDDNLEEVVEAPMNNIEKKYLFRFCYLVLLYIAGIDVKTEARKLIDQIRVVFKDDVP